MDFLQRGWVRWAVALALILAAAFVTTFPQPWRIMAASAIGLAMLGLAIVVVNRR